MVRGVEKTVHGCKLPQLSCFDGKLPGNYWHTLFYCSIFLYSRRHPCYGVLLNSNNNTHLYASRILTVVLALIGVFFMVLGEFGTAFSAFLATGLSLIPPFLTKSWKVYIPVWIEIVIVIALLVDLFGRIFNLYDVLHYDKLGHFFSSAVLAFLSIAILHLFDKYSPKFKLGTFGVIIFAVGVTVLLGVVWEVIEFAIDSIWDSSMQHGLEDTMWDLTIDLLAGVMVGLFASILLRNGDFERYAIRPYP